MKRLLLCALAASALQAGLAFAADSLATRVTSADGWVAWNVPMIADAGTPCCFSGGPGKSDRSGCDLDDRSHGFSTRDEPRPPDRDVLTVYAHVAHSRVDGVRAYDATCPVRSASEIRRIDGVEPGDSIGFLSAWMDGGEASARDEDALGAIAFHEDAAATRVLAAHAEASHPRKARESALFWLGQARGADGAAIVERYATTDGDPKLREHAIFALTQSHAGDPYVRIRAISGSDPSDRVRSQALFWMAQMNDTRAAADITSAIRQDASSEVREQGVFALSQLGDEKGDEALIALLKGDYPREVKKQALFWLGQSGSPRALQYFDAALTKSK
ncbi:MAG TPA: HEAT repeat domain-containing protein [Rhodanobacteraceae bacterium]|nr:HEAT repeat domain-containing protein [Rhodanobacteraceae bacterium]